MLADRFAIGQCRLIASLSVNAECRIYHA